MSPGPIKDESAPTAAPSVAEDPAVREAREKLEAFRTARDEATKAKRDAKLAKDLVLRLECEQAIAKFEDSEGAENIRWVLFEGFGVVILKRPSQVAYIKYRDRQKTDYLTNWAYAVPHILYPEKEKVEKEWLPILAFKLDEMVGALAVLVGVTVEDNLAK